MAQGTLVRVTSYRRSSEWKTRRRSIIRSTRMLRIRQYIGLDFSIASSISPLGPLRILTLTHFHKISRAEGPTRQYKRAPLWSRVLSVRLNPSRKDTLL